MFLVEADAAGVQRRGYPTQDGMRAAEVTFENTVATAIGVPGEALPGLERGGG